MKKTLLITLSTLALSLPAMAEETKGSLFSYQLGYSSNSVNAAGTTEPDAGGFYTGVDFFHVTPSGFGLGVGFDVNGWGPDNSRGISDGHGMYTMGATAKVGYTFENKFDIPLKLKAGIGYGLMDVTVHDGWGVQYETAAEYRIYKSFGLGIKYKYAEADMLGTTIKNDATIYYMSLGY
ncbi:MAG: outer membrane beta-barrel protein [Sulfuricurvum sp.]|nr:outer membrane beta-barrel protein [Sulfuricurvum sp.]